MKGRIRTRDAFPTETDADGDTYTQEVQDAMVEQFGEWMEMDMPDGVYIPFSEEIGRRSIGVVWRPPNHEEGEHVSSREEPAQEGQFQDSVQSGHEEEKHG